MRPCHCVKYEGILSQPLVEALRTARDEGAVEADRIADAAVKAHDLGLLTKDEMNEFILE